MLSKGVGGAGVLLCSDQHCNQVFDQRRWWHDHHTCGCICIRIGGTAHAGIGKPQGAMTYASRQRLGVQIHVYNVSFSYCPFLFPTIFPTLPNSVRGEQFGNRFLIADYCAF